MDHIITHFDIPAADPEALSAFYSNLFGWKIEKIGADPMPYWLIQTAPEGQGVGGGIGRKMDPSQRPTNYILVESIDDFAQRAVQLGGTLVQPKMEVPGWGYLALVLDPEGNPVGLWENPEQSE